jgi:hypothetical protein
MTVASKAGIKTITLLSSLDILSERSSNSERVFIIQGTGKDLITIRGNSAGIHGGGIFSSGAFFKAPESLCVIYGNDAPEENANSARLGSVVYISRDGYGDMIREQSAGRNVLLDSVKTGAAGGWQENAGLLDTETGLNAETNLSVETSPEPDVKASENTDTGGTAGDEFLTEEFSAEKFFQEAEDELSE